MMQNLTCAKILTIQSIDKIVINFTINHNYIIMGNAYKQVLGVKSINRSNIRTIAINITYNWFIIIKFKTIYTHIIKIKVKHYKAKRKHEKNRNMKFKLQLCNNCFIKFHGPMFICF